MVQVPCIKFVNIAKNEFCAKRILVKISLRTKSIDIRVKITDWTRTLTRMPNFLIPKSSQTPFPKLITNRWKSQLYPERPSNPCFYLIILYKWGPLKLIPLGAARHGPIGADWGAYVYPNFGRIVLPSVRVIIIPVRRRAQGRSPLWTSEARASRSRTSDGFKHNASRFVHWLIITDSNPL